MLTDLKNEIREALADSTAQKPVETGVLAKGHQRRRVEVALMELYQAREVGCCKIIKGGSEFVVWWIVNNSMTAPVSFRLAPPKAPRKRGISRMSDLTIEVKGAIFAQPGISMPELLTKLNKPKDDTPKIRNSAISLVNSGLIRTEGEKRAFRYFPKEQA